MPCRAFRARWLRARYSRTDHGKGHTNLGSGWDFSDSHSANAGLTLCGSDGSNFLAATWGGTWISYGTAGGAQAIWVR